MNTFETFLLLAGCAVALICGLTLVGYIVERVRDRLDPRRTRPVVFDRYKQDRVYDQDAE